MEITACTVLMFRIPVSFRRVSTGRVMVNFPDVQNVAAVSTQLVCDGLEDHDAAFRATCYLLQRVTGQTAGESMTNSEISELRDLLCQVGGC